MHTSLNFIPIKSENEYFLWVSPNLNRLDMDLDL